MTQTTEIAILPFKVMELAEIIAEKKRLSGEDYFLYETDSKTFCSSCFNTSIIHYVQLLSFKGWRYYV